MIRAARNYLRFLGRCVSIAFDGDWRYYTWVGTLTIIAIVGLNAYVKQFVQGLVSTGMSDQVSWGVYIANFTFLVGVAAAAVMLVIPVYIYRNEELHDLVIFGELLAVAAIIMCLAFVMVDLGHPDRFWHLIPGLGKFNFPGSMLSWDVVVLNGYLLLNVHICGYLLYCRYNNRKPAKWFYIPFVFVAIGWAISIHTVTAFLYVGLGGRPFWNSAIVGPRFIASAFTSGPAIIILTLQVIRKVTNYSPSGPIGATGSRPDLSSQWAIRPVTMEDIVELKKSLPELAAAREDSAEVLRSEAEVCEAPSGAEIMREGEQRRDAFFILNGTVKVTQGEGANLRRLHDLGAGEVVGEMSAITGSPRTATVTVEKPARLVRVPRETLRKLTRDAGIYHYIHSRIKGRVAISDRALLTLRSVVQVSMLINVFLLLNELFKEFYSESLHGASARYLFLGLHGHHALVPWIWTAMVFNLTAMVLLVLPVSQSLRYLNVACVLAIVGIWIEKGMGLVVPGFIPSPLGEIIEYTPTVNETLVCLGIWAFGLLCYTVFLRMSVPILLGTLNKENENPQSLSVRTEQLERTIGANVGQLR